MDGVYTGRSLRGAHGEGKAAAVRELAAEAGLDLAASTAYSDSHTDLPFLEAVGNPVVVNPDRELRESQSSATGRSSSSAELAYPSVRRLHPALIGLPFVVGAGAGMWAARAPCGLRSGSRRSGSPRPTRQRSVEHFLDAERAASSATGSARIEWLETLGDLKPTRGRSGYAVARLRALGRHGALGYLTLAAVCDAQLARPAGTGAGRGWIELFPDGGARLVLVRRLAQGGARRGIDGDVAGGCPIRRAASRSRAPIRSRSRSRARTASRSSRTSRGRSHLRRRPARCARAEELVPFGGEQAHKAFALALGLDLLVASLAGEGYGAVLVVARSRRRTPCRSYEGGRPG